MTKADLVEKVATKIDLTKKQTEVIVDTIFDNITKALKKGDKVELRGFGSFRVKKRGARQGRNPKSGENVFVEAKKVPFLKVGKDLKELVDSLK